MREPQHSKIEEPNGEQRRDGEHRLNGSYKILLAQRAAGNCLHRAILTEITCLDKMSE